MRRRLLLLVLAIAAITVPAPQDVASASCVAPTLHIGDADRPVVERGSRLAVDGDFFLNGCGDAVGVSEGAGCSGPHVQREEVRPMTDITLSIRQSGHVWTLATAAAATEAGRVSWSVTIPRRLQPGRAILVADQAQRLRVVVRR
jgi:hypothetical protein